MSRIVEFYRTADGKCPMEGFLDSLSAKHAQKVTYTLRLLEELDTLPRTHFKKLAGTEDIWECRTRQGGTIYRVLSFFHTGGKVVLTHGYQKKSTRTDPRQIRRAENCRRDYLSRHAEERSK